MRIRTAKFAMIPMWVIQHKTVQRNATRIAVYAGLQAAAWESPDNGWRSTREVAVAVAEITGISSEACRKHLSALVAIGAIIKSDDEVILPADDPQIGSASGSAATHAGSAATQKSDRTITREKPLIKPNAVGSHGASPDGDGGGVDGSEDDLILVAPPKRTRAPRDRFDEFWSMYPRQERQDGARRAWKAARKRQPEQQVIIDGLATRCAWWTRARTPVDKIPMAHKWLQDGGWNDVLAAPPKAAAASVAQANADLAVRQRDEVNEAIAAGDAEHAWKLIRSRAKARGDFWFDDIAQGLSEGRSDSALLVGHKRDGRRMTLADVDEVRAIKARLWQECTSPAIAQLSSSTHQEGTP